MQLHDRNLLYAQVERFVPTRVQRLAYSTGIPRLFAFKMKNNKRVGYVVCYYQYVSLGDSRESYKGLLRQATHPHRALRCFQPW